LGIYEDGDFGPQTKRCVEIFQKKAGIEDDGIVGPETSEKLFKLNSGEINIELPDWCKTEGGVEGSDKKTNTPKTEKSKAEKPKNEKPRPEKKIQKNQSTDGIILMGGLDYRNGDKSISQQVDMVKKSSGYENVIGHRYKMLNDVLNSIEQNPNYYVILFSAGCAHSRKIAKAMSNKSKLYIVEPYAKDPNTKSSVIDAVELGVPSRNVIVGPSSGRGSGVVDGATKTPSGIGHWGALEYAAKLL